MNREQFLATLVKIRIKLNEVEEVGKYDLIACLCDLGFEYTEIEDNMTDHTRWSVHHYSVFKIDNFYFGFSYEEPATEMQTGGYWFDIHQVIPKQITTTIYVPVAT